MSTSELGQYIKRVQIDLVRFKSSKFGVVRNSDIQNWDIHCSVILHIFVIFSLYVACFAPSKMLVLIKVEKKLHILVLYFFSFVVSVLYPN